MVTRFGALIFLVAFAFAVGCFVGDATMRKPQARIVCDPTTAPIVLVQKVSDTMTVVTRAC